MFSSKIKHWLERKPAYLRWRYSFPVYRLWLWLRADVRREIRRKKQLYETLVPLHTELIFDIGANEGMATELFRERAQTVIAVEPDARNFRILQAKFRNKLSVHLLPVAVSNKNGEDLFYSDERDSATGTLSTKWNEKKGSTAKQVQVRTVTLDFLIRKCGVPGFIKMDIEGNEWRAVQGLSTPVPLIVFEAMLPLFREETIACVQHLGKLCAGYRFTYSVEDKRVQNGFVSADQFLAGIHSLTGTIDIWCRR